MNDGATHHLWLGVPEDHYVPDFHPDPLPDDHPLIVSHRRWWRDAIEHAFSRHHHTSPAEWTRSHPEGRRRILQSGLWPADWPTRPSANYSATTTPAAKGPTTGRTCCRCGTNPRRRPAPLRRVHPRPRPHPPPRRRSRRRRRRRPRPRRRRSTRSPRSRAWRPYQTPPSWTCSWATRASDPYSSRWTGTTTRRFDPTDGDPSRSRPGSTRITRGRPR